MFSYYIKNTSTLSIKAMCKWKNTFIPLLQPTFCIKKYHIYTPLCSCLVFPAAYFKFP